MNKAESKNTELVFIILIPIFLVVIAFFYDIVLQQVQMRNLERVTNSIVTESLTTNFITHDLYEKFETDFTNAGIDTLHLSVSFEDDVLTVFNSHSYGAFFGRVFGTINYRSDIKVRAFLDGDEVVIERLEIKDDEYLDYTNE